MALCGFDLDRQLCAVVSGLVSVQVGVASANPTAPAPPLMPEEAVHVANAVAARRAEFAAGRAAARLAMTRLGCTPQAVPAARDRAPVWPAGTVGSISHSATLCIAVVARSGDADAIGIDIEPAVPLPDDLISEVCSASERAMIAGPDAGLLARLVFCAKEAAYKAQYPLTGVLFGFDHLEVVLDRAQHRFTATFQRPAGCFAQGDTLQGCFACHADHLVSAVTIGQGVRRGA